MTEMFGEAWPQMSVPDGTDDDEDINSPSCYSIKLLFFVMDLSWTIWTLIKHEKLIYITKKQYYCSLSNTQG